MTSHLDNQIINCRLCPRLIAHCSEMARKRRRAFQDWEYWGGPVPNFGKQRARLLIVGLAPAAHGANRTGRMFTGDRSGDWLYRALHRAGFANQADATSRSDGLTLQDCMITAICHCAPPENKPSRDELENCRPWLQASFDATRPVVVLTLGQMAWKEAVGELRRRGWWEGKMPKFGHGALVELSGGRWLLGSYHPSQQNTFTGRLTEDMLDTIFETVREKLDD